MFKKILSAAAVTALAAGVSWGATANAAPLPLPVHTVTTTVTYQAGSADLAVAAGDPTPFNGTPVHFDLQAALDGGHATAATLCLTVQGLEAAGIPAADFSTGFVGATCSTASLPLADETITLFVVDSHPGHAGSFEVAATKGGVALNVPATTKPVSGTAEVTWQQVVLPPLPTVPFVYHGHVLTSDQHNATVGWFDGIPDNAAAWKMGTVNGHVNHCVEVFVYGFDRPAGTAHVGFTCDNGNPAANVGYLRGLAPGHTYALFVQPATGAYGNNVPIPGTNPEAHITVVTPA